MKVVSIPFLHQNSTFKLIFQFYINYYRRFVRLFTLYLELQKKLHSNFLKKYCSKSYINEKKDLHLSPF